MNVLKIKIPLNISQRMLEKRANREKTRTMQALLSGLESPYRRFEWTVVSDQLIDSQSLPKEAADRVLSVLKKAGVHCQIRESGKSDEFIITVDTNPEKFDPQTILSEHRKKILKSMGVSEDAQAIKELVDIVSTAWDKLSTSPEDTFNLLRDAPPIIIELAEKLDELFIGMKEDSTKRSTSETALLSSVYYSNLFLNIFSKASPDLFRLAFKKTPIGPIFIAGYQIASDLFYVEKWQAGRERHLSAQFSMGERSRELSDKYNLVQMALDAAVALKKAKLQMITDLNDTQINDLIDNENTNLLNDLPDSIQIDARNLISDINNLKSNMAEAAKSIKELTTELRKQASRINTEQQMLMATKHIDRIFNITFIALGIATFFFPPLAIPATILAVGKGAARKKIEDRMRTGTEIVQGIYVLDNTIVLSSGSNKNAIKKAKDVKKMNLQYAPPAVVGIKLGIRQKATFARTRKLIRNNPEYTLYIPDTFSYKWLDVNATRRQIRGQVDYFSQTCRQLIFHLGVIEGKDLNGEISKDLAHLHPPTIHNINELRDLIDDWYENVSQQIRDQQLNPRSGKNSYFSSDQMESIYKLYSETKRAIYNYEKKMESLDNKKGEDLNTEFVFDMEYADKMHASIMDEIASLRSILDNKSPEQSVTNATDVKERLDKRVQSLLNYCDKCPDNSLKAKFQNWKKYLNIEIDNLNKQMQTIKSEKLSPSQIRQRPKKSPSERNLGIEVKPSKNNNQVFVTVQHPRYFESRNAIVERLKEHVKNRKNKSTELVLLPVSKITKKVLFNYRGSYWKMIWLVRGIDRAIESIELTVNNKQKIGVEINPENLKSLLDFYRAQLQKINDYSESFTFSKSGKDIVKARVQQTIERIEIMLKKQEPAFQAQKSST